MFLKENENFVSRTLQFILNAIKQHKKFRVSVSFLKIHDDRISDLSSLKQKPKLSKGSYPCIENTCELNVSSLTDFNSYMKKCLKNYENSCHNGASLLVLFNLHASNTLHSQLGLIDLPNSDLVSINKKHNKIPFDTNNVLSKNFYIISKYLRGDKSATSDSLLSKCLKRYIDYKNPTHPPHVLFFCHFSLDKSMKRHTKYALRYASKIKKVGLTSEEQILKDLFILKKEVEGNQEIDEVWLHEKDFKLKQLVNRIISVEDKGALFSNPSVMLSDCENIANRIHKRSQSSKLLKCKDSSFIEVKNMNYEEIANNYEEQEIENNLNYREEAHKLDDREMAHKLNDREMARKLDDREEVRKLDDRAKSSSFDDKEVEKNAYENEMTSNLKENEFDKKYNNEKPGFLNHPKEMLSENELTAKLIGKNEDLLHKLKEEFTEREETLKQSYHATIDKISHKLNNQKSKRQFFENSFNELLDKYNQMKENLHQKSLKSSYSTTENTRLIQETHEENEKLRDRNNTLEHENDILNQKVKELLGQLQENSEYMKNREEQFNESHDAPFLSFKLKETKKKKDRLKRENEQLLLDYDRLKDKYDEDMRHLSVKLEKNKDNRSQQIEKLEDHIKSIELEIQRLRFENKELKNRESEMIKQTDALENAMVKYREKYKDLKNSNTKIYPHHVISSNPKSLEWKLERRNSMQDRLTAIEDIYRMIQVHRSNINE